MKVLLLEHINTNDSQTGEKVKKYNYTVPIKRRKRQKTMLNWILEFSKRVVVICVILYIIIEIFAIVAIWHFMDTTALITLISETSEVLKMGVFGYMIKAGIENWQQIKKSKQESENKEGDTVG